MLHYLETDPLAGLLLRLTKRGAAIGRVDGGSGLLGWLDHDEASAMVAALEPYDLRPDAPMPDPDADAYGVRKSRETVLKLRTAATHLARRGRGIALSSEL